MQNPLQVKGSERAQAVSALFAQIAERYDTMNWLMTAGQDAYWRAEVIRRARLVPGGSLLDLGAGTGDLAGEALRHDPTHRAVAADFTLNMLRVGKSRLDLYWCNADALNLPFPEQAFDAVVSGFLMRNVTDLQQALSEQWRVLKPGGRIVILETTPPRRDFFWPFIWVYLHAWIPLLGWLVTGNMEAYAYLGRSTARFVRAEELAVRMAIAGFKKVGFRRRMFGAIAIHWGEKQGV